MSTRKKSVDKSLDYEEFVEQTSDYLPPAKSTPANKQLNKDSNKQNNSKTSKQKKKVYIGDLFNEPAKKERNVNTTLQLPESLNERLKEFCSQYGKSKNEVIKTLVEALLDEKGF